MFWTKALWRGNLRIYNVHNAIRNQDVGSHDLGAVDEDGAVHNGDGHVVALECLDRGAVRQVSAVGNGAIDDVVLEDARQLCHGQITDSRANGLESSIVGNEDGHVGQAVDGTDKVGVREGTGGGAQSSFYSGGGDVQWDGEHGVNHVKDTSSKVDILEHDMSTRSSSTSLIIQWTYGLSDSGVRQQS